MITIKLNSKEIAIVATMTLQEVLEMNGLMMGHFAIAINRQFIPRSAYVTTGLNAGDQIDVVTPMQGG